MLLILSLIFAVFPSPLRNLLLSLLMGRKIQEGNKTNSDEQLAEVHGGVWEQPSVFAHIEQGLKKNPDGPAVISTIRSADAIPYLVSRETHKTTTSIASVAQKSSLPKSSVSPFQNGAFSPSNSAHSRSRLEQRERRAKNRRLSFRKTPRQILPQHT